MSDLVSIITPTYNSSSFILETISSIVSQSFKNWELIIVDDCSTDNTVEIIKDYIKKSNEKRIRIIINESNLGAAVSRNRAIKKAKGRWIAFLDSDDLWKPWKLEEQIKFMEDNNYHFSYTYYIQIDENSNPNGKMLIGPKKVTKRMMQAFCWIGCLTVMYDAEYVGLIQIPDLKKRNDYAMWLKVIEKCNCYCYPKVCAMYRVRQGSISRVSVFKLVKHHKILFKSIYGCSSFKASLYTLNNIIWGCVKKVVCIKQNM